MSKPVVPSVVVDTRPLPRILAERSLRPLLLLATVLLYWFVVTRPVPEGLTQAGLNVLGIFVVCLVLWVTSALPLMITSLLAIIMLPLTGVMPASKAFALFGKLSGLVSLDQLAAARLRNPKSRQAVSSGSVRLVRHVMTSDHAVESPAIPAPTMITFISQVFP
jgi:di/tricarboxylate transporter